MSSCNVPNVRTSGRNDLLRRVEVDDAGGRRFVSAILFDAIALNLIRTEHGVLTHQGERRFLLFAIGVLLGGLDWLPENDLGAPGPRLNVGRTFHHLTTDTCPLLIRPPPFAREGPTLGRKLEKKRVDSKIELL